MINRFLWMIFLAAGAQVSWGFALLGPLANGGDTWQTGVIGYGYAYLDESSQFSPGGPVYLGDIGGPKNIGEGYRRNVPTLYYSYDANFLGFFGPTGASAADSAYAIMNSLTNVDSYSSSLSEFPFSSQHFNFEAQTLFLTDIKSVTLHLLVEQMGLAQPERYTWTLAERVVPPGCPLTTEYLVLQRNYGINPSPLNQVQYSPYVNDDLYSYYIVENCTGGNPLAYTVPFSVNLLNEEYTSVAANDGDGFGGALFSSGGGLQVGGFYTGLTLDDVAGLRYLLTSNNIVRETSGAGALLLTTNIGTAEQVITTQDLGALLAASVTNSPATLAALYPGLVVLPNSTSTFAPLCTQTVTTYFTNQIGAPYPSPLVSVFVTNSPTCVYQQIYSNVFGNVITNGNLAGNPNIINGAGIALNYSPNTTVTLVTVSLGNQVGAPYGSPPVTNTTVQTVTVAGSPSGEFFLIPPGLCGLQIIPGSMITGPTVYTTNVIASATNTTTTATNNLGFVATQTIITSFTPHQFLAKPIVCASTANTVGLREGIENVQFVRANYDSLIGQFFQPITNYYTMVAVTNSQAATQYFQRVITQPDILMNADNFIAGNTFNGSVSRNINFDQGNILPGLAGPGVINSPVTFNYNRIGTAFRNGPIDFYTAGTVAFLSQLTQYPTMAWASFDSSTNDPVVYPNGTSIANLENQIIVQISPAALAAGTHGVFYGPVTFTATGGSFQPPFAWSWTPVGTETLPPGLTLSSGGTISGTPTQSGTFDFILQLTDSLFRTVQWQYTIIIN
jgi:hypothetical protein